MPAEQIQTLSRAVAVLDCFTQEHAELGVREIARMVNLSSSAAGRLLAALKDMGVLSQNPETRAYSMGVRVLNWANVYNTTLDIRNKAMGPITELHRATRETISLYILDGDERVCVERIESPQNVRIVQRIGRRLPLYAGSAGKAILAFLPPDRREEILEHTHFLPLTPKTITDLSILRNEFEKARLQGWVASYGEWVEDAAGVAAPILGANGQVIGAMSISGPISRFQPETVAVYGNEIKKVAAEISTSLGYNANEVFPTGA